MTTKPAMQYEYRTITLPREVSINDSRRILTEEAEHGHWELARTRLYSGGMRRYWLRRKTIRVESTLYPIWL